MAKSNEIKSLPKVKKIHGVEIEKKPCGKYFEALQTLKNLPEDFIKELSDNGQEFKISEMFTMENIMTLVTRLLIVMPDFTFEFLSKLLEIDRKVLEEQLTPKELLDVIQEFWKINELESFFRSNEANIEQNYNPNWLQRTIAICIKIGISKKEFLEDYYPDEIPIIMQEYSELNKTSNSEEEEVGAEDF